MMVRLRVLAFATAVVVAGLLFVSPKHVVADETDEPLKLASNINYNVKATDDAVHVAWDATVTNDDPTSTFRNGQGFYYYAYGIPILNGATSIKATSSAGNELDVEVRDAGSSVVQSAVVTFDRGIFYGETYNFRVSYDLVGGHSRAAVVTPFYGYVAVVGAGDPATITVNLPSGDPWTTSLEGSSCGRDGSTFTCTGAQGPYVAAVAEASQPGHTGTLNFDVRLTEKTVSVSLTYFEGDEATAQHQQALILAGLPVIEQTFGFRYPGPLTLKISHGGQQAVLGYEGLAGCDTDSCKILISPAASDHTLLHELSHMWTGIFDERWLSEGYAEMVAISVSADLPEGTAVGGPPERVPATSNLQLDDWAEASSLIGADADRISLEDAGYYYSLRVMEELRSRLGLQALQAVNRNIATSGNAADSRRFMDLLEDATGENSDNTFLVWVFPEDQRPVIAQRREARDRYKQLSDRLSAEALPGDVLIPIKAQIDQWSFTEATAALDRAESGLETYAELLPELQALKDRSEQAGLKLPASIEAALITFDFGTVREQVASAGQAITAYESAGEKVRGGRSLWTSFGLLGSSPGGKLDDAAESFSRGDFEQSRRQSDHARELVEGASSVALKRLLLVGGLMAVLALALGIAYAVGHLRERELDLN
jgi:hypothetical protein